MRGLEKNCTRWHIHTDRQTDTHTDGHGDSKTNSAKRAELVKNNVGCIKVDPMVCGMRVHGSLTQLLAVETL